jgi:hypothetical protein
MTFRTTFGRDSGGVVPSLMPMTTRSPECAVKEMNLAFDKTMSKSPG